MSTLAVDAIVDSSNGNTATINGTTPTAYNTMGKNLIINGAMEIAQRGTSATISTAQSYKTVDRIKATGGFGGYTNTESQDTSVVPEGFTTSYKWANTASAGAISSGAYNVIDYKVEGYSMSHLDWGKSSAKTVTLSFYVRSGVTGTYGIGLLNGTSNVYMTTYTVNSADTWERKTIVIPGPTVGSWNTTTSTGLTIRWDMGVGTTYSTSTTEDWTLSGNIWGYTGGVKFVETNNVDFYLTGVQLEAGSVATEFERRPYGTELALCQRYYEKSWNVETAVPTATDVSSCMFLANRNPGFPHILLNYKVTKRTSPTIVLYSSTTNTTGKFRNLDAAVDIDGGSSRIGANQATLYSLTSTSLGQFIQFHYTISAEL